MVSLPAWVEGNSTAVISGTIRRADGNPAKGAWVRVQTTSRLAYAAEDGSFTLDGLTAGQPVVISAWIDDHKVGWANVVPPAGEIVIVLQHYDTRDNPAYAWNTSYADPANPTLGCGHCMSPSFQEWKQTAHAMSGTNPRFFSLYNGTDLSGTREVLPGYQQDFPGTAGNCAACHAPGAACDLPFTANMNKLTGVQREGVFCEYCHKIGAVYLNPATGRPYNNAPGVMSTRLYRPFGDDQIFFGSLDDVARRVSYLPLEKKSGFCAPCHQFSFWGTPIYQSYREWQESAYPGEGFECQTCHMPPGNSATFVLPDKGGLARDPLRQASHLDLGLKDADFMKNTLGLTLTAVLDSGTVKADVTLTNVNAGHHVPTDSPLRHMLLIVHAADKEGKVLTLQSGPVVPFWGGDYAGRAGQGYAKILKDPVSGQSPVINYWKQTIIESDNRIPARGTDLTQYVFASPSGRKPIDLSATLVFRRAFHSVEISRNWPASDLVLAQVRVPLTEPGIPVTATYQPEKISKPDKGLQQKIEIRNSRRRAPIPLSPVVAHRQEGPRKRSSSALAVTADGSRLLVANPDSNSISIVETSSRKVTAELTVGIDPRTLTVDDAGGRAYVANRGSDTVSVVDLADLTVLSSIAVGSRPYGIVVSPDGRRLYVAEQGSSRIRLLNALTGNTLGTVPVADRPGGLAISDDGKTLYVTHLLSNRITILKSLDFFRSYLPAIHGASSPSGERQISSDRTVAGMSPATVSLWTDSNLVQSIVLSPDRTRAYLPHTRSNTSNRALTFDTTVFPMVSVIDLLQEQHLVGRQLDLGVLDPPGVGLPFDAALTPDGKEIWIVNAASNNVSVVDPSERKRLASIPVGDNPRGIVMAPDGLTVYVSNALAGTISVIDTSTYSVRETIPVTTLPLPPLLLQGKRLFHSSRRSDLAKARWIACNTCHYEGEQDGRTWFFGFAGWRNTTGLLGMIGTYPLRWSGEWDESSDAEFAIRRENFGTGLIAGEMNCLISPPNCVHLEPNQGRSNDLDSLALFMDGLETARSPYPMDGNARRGRFLFQRKDLRCTECHAAPLYTDLKKHDVGTSTAEERIGPEYDTPTLLGLHASAPYFHDGSAKTLRDTLTRNTPGKEHDVTGLLTEAEIQDLISFLLALPYE